MAGQASRGDSVRIHYTGTLRDGKVFDSSRGRLPLQFTVGSGQVIEGFDRAVDGMRVGDHKTVTIPAEQAYGARRHDLMMEIPLADFPEDIEPELGQQLEMGTGERTLTVRVREVTSEHVTLDANHELAGEDLTFALELVSIA